MRETAENLRADARSNREEILRAALEVFCERGTGVAMKDIADRAGVGVGTLYRRFPDRDALLVATAQNHMQRITDLVATAAREEPTAWLGLSRVLYECAEMRLGAQASAIEPAAHELVRADAWVTETRDALIGHLRRLTERAHADGELRAEVGLADIEVLMTVQIYPRDSETYTEAVRRVMGFVLDGLRTHGDSTT
ncbi:TetR/AcrR family transcriptional regulator [Nocardia sp. NBC_00511]|uniref:TetR/AcrR family transcriptional regulator n=1 Tax=Nocardia sp. NBC_00511 TaxID=2903591 RepID=UPI0030DF2DDE